MDAGGGVLFKHCGIIGMAGSPQVRSLKGTAIGKLYISTDIQLLRQTRTRPDIVVRAAIVTASEDTEKYARFFWANSTLLVHLNKN